MTDGLTIGSIERVTSVESGSSDSAAVGRSAFSSTLATSLASTQAGSPNPRLQLDPALGLVVIQFRDGDQGSATSIPTQQQLEAYRDGSAAIPGHRAHKTA